MKSKSIRITINAPREKVFSILTDYEKIKEWAKGIEKIEPIEGEPATTGFKYYSYIKEGNKVTKYNSEVLSAKAPEHISMSNTANGATISLSYILREVPEGTTLESSFSMHTKSKLFQFIGWLFAGMMRKMAMKQLRELKRMCEEG